MIKVLFLCLGNICRSPMAEAVFAKMVEQAGCRDQILIDSAGLSDWHAGNPPHQGTLKILTKYSLPHEWIRSRQITKQDLQDFDYIIAMDAENVRGLEERGADRQKVIRLLDLVPDSQVKNVPDPYYTGNFEEVYELISAGCLQLLNKIKQEQQLST